MERHRANETKICGQHACRAVLRTRPQDVLKIYVRDDRVGDFGDVLQSMARQRRPYKVVADVELERLTESTHHEGICVVVKARPPVSLESVVGNPGPQCLLALTDVANPHNVGAILRTAAHFGVRAALLGPGGRISPAAARTAQGGAEAVDVVSVDDWRKALITCRSAGHRLVATSSHAQQSLFETALPTRAVVLVGSEAMGLPADVAALADLQVTVPGSGRVESLNVGAATAVVLAEVWRQQTNQFR